MSARTDAGVTLASLRKKGGGAKVPRLIAGEPRLIGFYLRPHYGAYVSVVWRFCDFHEKDSDAPRAAVIVATTQM